MTTPAAATPPNEVSLVGLANAVLRKRRPIVALALVFGLVLGGFALLQPRTFTSTASFMPQTRRSPSNLSGIAAQLGLAGFSAEGGQTPAFYADLARSRQLLGLIADAPVASDSAGRRLADIYDVRGRTEALRREALTDRLQDDVEADVVTRTGTVRLTARAPLAPLAKELADRVVSLLNQFNLETRQSQASAERRFAERRLGEVRSELRDAEDRLQAFLQRNRDYRNSPELSFQHERLSREVAMRQQVFTTMAQAFEQAKLEEVRDTPVITVVEAPTLPVRPDSRGVVRKAVLGIVLGGLVGLALALIPAFLSDGAPGGAAASEREEFRALRRQLLEEVAAPLRFFRGGLRSAG